MTLITDYILGALGLLCAFLLFRMNHVRPPQISVRLWAWSFIALASAAFFGGTSHGFGIHMSPLANRLVWKFTVLSVGLVSLFMLAGTIAATFQNPPRRWLIAAVLLKFLLYAAWMFRHDKFLYVICDYAPSMLVILFLQIRSRWLVAGVLVSFAAAGVQAAEIRLHEHFNHNDLYHVIQMFAVYLFYKGARLLTDKFSVTGR